MSLGRLRRHALSFLAGVFGCAAVAATPALALPRAKPEEAGFNAERLKRLDEHMQAMVDHGQIAGGVTLSSVHDDIKNCLPGQYWLMKERTEMDIRGNILVETYKGSQLRTTAARTPGGIENNHFLASYEESNYCPDDEPIELDKPDCASFSMTGTASLSTSLYSPRRRQVVISSRSKPSMSRSAARSVSARPDSGRPNIRTVSCR